MSAVCSLRAKAELETRAVLKNSMKVKELEVLYSERGTQSSAKTSVRVLSLRYGGKE